MNSIKTENRILQLQDQGIALANKIESETNNLVFFFVILTQKANSRKRDRTRRIGNSEKKGNTQGLGG